MSDWCDIESDPGVFTALVEKFGVTGCEFQELWSLDDEMLPSSAYGLIFLFKWNRESASLSGGDSVRPIPPHELSSKAPGMFFAKQVVTNACATQAILSILLNYPATEGTSLVLGDVLTEFKAFTSDFDSELKGEMIGSSEAIKVAHNSFCKQDPFVSEGKRAATTKDDLYHFIAYVPFGGKVYEIDGLKVSLAAHRCGCGCGCAVPSRRLTKHT